jgi:hypothetical protein
MTCNGGLPPKVGHGAPATMETVSSAWTELDEGPEQDQNGYSISRPQPMQVAVHTSYW